MSTNDSTTLKKGLPAVYWRSLKAKEDLRVLAEKVIELERGLDNEGISSGIIKGDDVYNAPYKVIAENFPDIKAESSDFLSWRFIEEVESCE